MPCDGGGACEHVIAIGAGVVCRSSDGPCDVPESCDGVYPLCPPDAFDTTQSICDPASGGCPNARCTGTSAQCPRTYDILPCPPPTTTTTTLPELECPPVPEGGCLDAGGASFQVKDNSDPAKDQIKWKWGKGPQVVVANLGNPRFAATYGLCVYDSTAASTRWRRA
jgi:hypothetical protein